MNLHRPMTPARLNLGSGKDFRLDYLNVDIDPSWYPDAVLDLSTVGSLDDGIAVETTRFGTITLVPESLDEIIANDVLGHVPDLVAMMTGCLRLLRFGGVFDINVSYDLSFGGWQDPTHLRTFNERSWLYYSEWYWYLGWEEARFDVENIEFVLSPVGSAIRASGVPDDELIRTPRAVDSMQVRLRKVRPNESDRQNFAHFRGRRQEAKARAAPMASAPRPAAVAAHAAAAVVPQAVRPAPAEAVSTAPAPGAAYREAVPAEAAAPADAALALFPGGWTACRDRYCLWVVSPEGYVHHQAFAEVAAALSEAFAELGGSAPVVRHPSEWADRVPIVFGAHLLAQVGVPLLPGGSIVVNLEQISDESTLLTPGYRALLRGRPVLDFSERNRNALAHIGIRHTGLLGIGYSPCLTRIRPAPEAGKDIDVLFYGSINERRAQVISGLRERGLSVTSVFGVYGPERDGLIARAKVVLNLHYYRASIFEAVRVSYLLANGACVVSEGDPADPDAARFVGGLELVPYDRLVETCAELVADPERREALARTGFARITANPQAELLRAGFFPDLPARTPAPAAAVVPVAPAAAIVHAAPAAAREPERHLPPGYTVRTACGPRPEPAEGVMTYPQVYELVARLVDLGGFERVVVIGGESNEALRALDERCQIICIDAEPRRARATGGLPNAVFVPHDLETGLPRLKKQVLHNAVILCLDIVSRLGQPERLLADLARLSSLGAYTLITTPDRVRTRGLRDLGPPQDPSRTMEWSADEFSRLLRACGFPEGVLVGYTLDNSRDQGRTSVLALAGCEAVYVPSPRPSVAAIVNVYNEADVIEAVVRHLHAEGVAAHVIDNWSTDGSYEIAQALEREGVCAAVLRFPERPTRDYEWANQLRHSASYAAGLPAEWVIHYDADEFRHSPWEGVKLADALGFVGACGYNAVNFTVADFLFTRDQAPGPFSRARYRHFEFNRQPAHQLRVNAWRNTGATIDLASSGGHLAQFPGLRVFPLKFLIHHFPLRDREQAQRKIFRDRLPRIEQERREKGWHVHYDTYQMTKTIEPWRRHELVSYDPHGFAAEYLVERLSGIGIELEVRATPNIDTRFKQDEALQEHHLAFNGHVAALTRQNERLREQLERFNGAAVPRIEAAE
ncbi:glycosyltransferase family 2 protein [uncultured Methylobacterium sp.]|jgi:hypothetical protein|uniref:glycosyltransferase family 2 protein n=1 Tax=uncultured Methylobacterium sp. TaxID=157278 RepID=UPI00260310D8|nr:glycosyltransferase family 2 protein [uncultured Methylobacterium sp.]